MAHIVVFEKEYNLYFSFKGKLNRFFSTFTILWLPRNGGSLSDLMSMWQKLLLIYISCHIETLVRAVVDIIYDYNKNNDNEFIDGNEHNDNYNNSSTIVHLIQQCIWSLNI